MLLKSEYCLLKYFRIEVFIFPMDTPCLLIRAMSGLIAVENDSGLLLALVILSDSTPIVEQTILDDSLLDLSGIVTIEKGNESLLSKRPKLNFPSFRNWKKNWPHVYQYFLYLALIH